MQRKETFATSGSRLQLRFFGGESINNDLFSQTDWLSALTDKVVPMGGKLSVNKSPTFAVWAIKDSEGANLDRIQIIKAWIDATGEAHEKIINIAWSGEREISADGSLTKLPSTVDVKSASYSSSQGSVELKAVWTDPDYSPNQLSMYYMRVLEIETPRWSTYDAKELGIDIPDDLSATIVERGWSSPIWVN